MVFPLEMAIDRMSRVSGRFDWPLWTDEAPEPMLRPVALSGKYDRFTGQLEVSFDQTATHTDRAEVRASGRWAVIAITFTTTLAGSLGGEPSTDSAAAGRFTLRSQVLQDDGEVRKTVDDSTTRGTWRINRTN